MPGIPLLNLGTALGGFTQGYQNSRDSQMQNALRQLALQQYQSQQNAARIAGRGLMGGVLDQMQTGSPAPQPTGPASAQSPVPTPMPPFAGPTPPPPGQPSAPKGDPSTADDAGYSSVLPPDAGGPAVPPPDQGNYWDQKSTGPAPAPAPQQTAAPPATDSSAQPKPVDTHVEFAAPNGQSIGIPDFFRTVDTTKIAQGLAKLSPGADPADIYQATSDLLKLANGNKNEQLQAAYLAKMMGVNMQIQGRKDVVETQQAGALERTKLQQAGAGERTTEQIAGRKANVETQQTGAAGRQQAGFDFRQQQAQQAQADRKELLDIREKAIDARSKARLEQIAATASARAARVNPAAKIRIDAIHQQIMAIKAEGKTGGGLFTSPQISPENQQKLKDLTGQLAGIVSELGTAPPAGQ